MEIELKNIAGLKDATLDLAPITLLLSENGAADICYAIYEQLKKKFANDGNKIYYFPLEREALYQLQQLCVWHIRETKCRIPDHVYFEFMRFISGINPNRKKIKSEKRNKSRLPIFKKLAKKIEKDISASVLQPFVDYLNYVAETSEFLIIEMPELGLHPVQQVKFIEVLAILANNGITILLTTHSPYVCAHLSNLHASTAESVDLLAKQANSLYLKDKRALLKDYYVSAYLRDGEELVSIKREECGFEWCSIADINADLYNMFYELYNIGHPREMVESDSADVNRMRELKKEIFGEETYNPPSPILMGQETYDMLMERIEEKFRY